MPAPPPSGGAPPSTATSSSTSTSRSTSPMCYVAITDPPTRTEVVTELRAKGWDVVEHATTFHLLADLSDCILGQRPWQSVGLIVVEDTSPGLRGTTIAHGLRELGVSIPVIVVERTTTPLVAERDAPQTLSAAS
jgi:FixJ family two-component response regulator